MAGGILSANDAGAFWREAAPTSEPPQGATGDLAGQDVVIPNSNKFKTPANGLKKLLDTIDTTTNDLGYYGPNAHPKVAEWLKTPSNAYFAKTYFKPGNKALLQHVLGEGNYTKLLQHAPNEHAMALQHHQQKPAPNSNKYKTPTNGLAKLLHAPGLTPEKTKAWMDAHPDYVKGYLTNPEYRDAIKGDLGKGGYDLLQEHLKAPDAPNPAFQKPPGGGLSPKGQEVADSAAKAFGPAGFAPITQEQALAPEGTPAPQGKPLKNPFAELLKNQPPGTGQVTEDAHGEPVNSEHYDALKAQVKSPQSVAGQDLEDPAFHGWFHSHTKADQADLSKSWSNTHVKFQKWLAKHPQGTQPLAPDDQDEVKQIQDLLDHPGSDAGKPSTPAGFAPNPGESGHPEHTVHVAIPAAINKVFPNADLSGMDDAALKTQLESWLKYLPDHEGFEDHVPALQKVYDQFFGAGAKSPSAPSPEPSPPPSESSDKHQVLLDKINAIKPGWIKQKSWLQAQDEANNLQTAIKGWTKNQHLTPEQQAQFQKLHDEYFGGKTAPQPGSGGHPDDWEQQLQAQPSTPQAPVLPNLKGLLVQQGIFQEDDKENIAVWTNKTPEQQKADITMLAQGISPLPENHGKSLNNKALQAKWKKVYDQAYGEPATQKPLGVNDPDFQAWAKSKGWNGENAESALGGTWLDKYQKEQGDKSQPSNPAAAIVTEWPSAMAGLQGKTSEQVKAQLQQWASPEFHGSSSTVEKAKKYLQQYFPEPGSGGHPDDWEQQLQAQPNESEPADQGYGDEAYSSDDDEEQSAFASHQLANDLDEAGYPGAAEAFEGKLTSEQAKAKLQQYINTSSGDEKDDLQKLYDKHFGKGASTTPDIDALIADLGFSSDSSGAQALKANPEQAEEFVKGWASGSTGNAAAYKKVYDKYFGKSTPVPQDWKSQSQTLVQDYAKIFHTAPDNVGLQYHLTSPENAKAYLEKQIKAYSGELDAAEADKVNAMQALIDKHLGASDDPWGSNAAGMTPTTLSESDLGAKAFDQDEAFENIGKIWGVGIGSLGSFGKALQDAKDPEAIKALVEDKLKEWQSEDTDHGHAVVQKLKSWLTKYYGPSTAPSDLQHLKNLSDLAKIQQNKHGWTVDAQDYKEWEKTLTPEQVTDYLADPTQANHDFSSFISDFDYHSGDKSTNYDYSDIDAKLKNTALTTGTGVAAGTNTPADMLAPDGTYNKAALDYLKQSGWPVPGETSHHDGWSPASWKSVQTQQHSTSSKNKDWVPWEQFKAKQGLTGGSVDHQSFLQGLVGKGQIDQELADSISAQTPKMFQDNVDYVKDKMAHGSNNFTGTPWPVIVSEWDKASKGGAPAGPPPFDSDSFKSEFADLFPGSGWIKQEGDKDPVEAEQKLKGLVDSADANYPGTDKTQKAHDLYDKYFGEGKSYAPKAAPTTPSGGIPAADILGIANASMEVVDTAAFAALSPEKQQQKLKKLIDNHKDEGYDSAAQELQDVYDKHFGGGYGGGLSYSDAEDQSLSGPQIATEPEEDQGVSPSKSESATPEEVSTQAQAKPTNGAEFKNFAKWWGAKQLSPEDEAAIYHAWFPNKESTSPEQASKWFQQVFEHYSKPGSGDLTAEGTPAWASNSWALGNKAATEWPLFKQWAQNDPGIPKGLSIKQKVAIWKSLSAGDKKVIEENYDPANEVDSQAVVGELSAAYPDSNWADWAKMAPGTLKSNVELLAKHGYHPAIPIFNKYFGGKLPMPKVEQVEEEEAKPTSTIPVDKLPSWVGAGYGGWGKTESTALKFTGLQNFATALGGKEAVTGTEYPNTMIKLFQQMPLWMQHDMAATPAEQLPFHSPDQFTQWLAEQPKAKDVFAGVAGVNPESYLWASVPGSGYSSTQKKTIEKALQGAVDNPSSMDPALFAKTLDSYNKIWGANKPTLAQALTGAYPIPPKALKAKSWDEYLKSHSKADITKFLKKQLKAEANPETWIKLVDMWPKFIGGPTGHAKLTPYMKSLQSGTGLGPDQLKALHKWKSNGDPQASVPSYWQVDDYDGGDYIKSLAKDDQKLGGTYYYGWTPPGHKGGGYVADPAQLGAQGITTYQAPAADKKGKQYEGLLAKMDTNKAAYSSKDREMATSEEFANWFSQAPTSYKESFQHNPGIALDDFKAFTEGNLGTSEVPEGDGQKHYYDLSPHNLVEKNKSTQKIPGVGGYEKYPFWKANPQQEQGVKFPRVPDEQETIPLPAGQQWAPKYAPMPIYRSVGLNTLWSHNSDPDKERIRKEIVGILEGTGSEGIDNQPNLFSDESFQKDWAKDAPKDKPYGEKAWMDFSSWASKHKVPGEQMYDLAKKWGFDHPEEYGTMPLSGTKGNWDDPRLGKLILDYMTTGSEGHSSHGGLGIHWTRSRGKGYDPAKSVNVNMKYEPGSNLPVTYTALWGGQGEDPGGSGGAYSPTSPEQEHTLLPGAPVLMRRLQIKDGNGDWHDLMDYGPISMWPKGRDERFIPGSGSSPLGYVPLSADDPKTKESLDKPSLAATLTKMVGKNFTKSGDDPNSGIDFWDNLVPGVKADHAFAQLLKDHPAKEKEIQKIYRWFFVGRPEMETKAHFRTAALQRTVRTIEADFDLLANGWEEDGYGGQDPDVWAPSAPLHLTSPMFPAHQNLSGDDDGKRPRLQTHQPGDPNTGHFYFSPHEVNPHPTTNARPPDMFAKEDLGDQLPLEGMPKGHGDMPLHRGYSLDYGDEDPLARAMSSFDHDDPRIRDLILEHLGQQGVYYGPHHQYDLGNHWTTDRYQADNFAASNNERGQIPVSVTTSWHGTGEDPYRSDTWGDYPSEKEVTLLPGAKAPVTHVRYRHPDTQQWHEFTMEKPVERMAALEVRLLEAEIEGLVDPQKMWNNFGELDVHHPGTETVGHQGPPVRHKQMWRPPVTQVEAAIDRLAWGFGPKKPKSPEPTTPPGWHADGAWDNPDEDEEDYEPIVPGARYRQQSDWL